MRTQLETREYEFSHGKRPSGKGRWAFKVLNTVPCENKDALTIQSQTGLLYFDGTLTEAKKELKQTIRVLAPSTTIVTVKVMP